MGKAMSSSASANSAETTTDELNAHGTPVPLAFPFNVGLEDTFYSITIVGLRRIAKHGVVLKGKRYRPSKKTTLADFVRQLKLPLDVAFVDCLSDDIACVSKEHAGLFLVAPPRSSFLDVTEALDLYVSHHGDEACTTVWLDTLCFPQRQSQAPRRNVSRMGSALGAWRAAGSGSTPPRSPESPAATKTSESKGRSWMHDKEYSFAQIAKFQDFAVFINSFNDADSHVKAHFQSQFEIWGVSECRRLCKVLLTPSMERHLLDALVQDFENVLYMFVDIDTANSRDATSDAGDIKSKIKHDDWNQLNFVFTGAMRAHIRVTIEREIRTLREANKLDVNLLKLGLGHAGMMLDLAVFNPSLEEELLKMLDIIGELSTKATSQASKSDLQTMKAMAYEYLGLRLISAKETSPQVVEYYEKALEIRLALGGRSIPAARTKVALGRALTLVGRYNDALSTLTDAIEMTRSVRGGSHPELASALSAKATVLFKQEKLAEANAEFEKANVIKKKVRNTMTVLLEDPQFRKDIKRLGATALAMFDQADDEVSNAAKAAVEKALHQAEQRASGRGTLGGG